MTQILKAIFDGKVFRPEGSVKIPAHSSVKLTVQTSPAKKKAKPYSLFRKVAAMKMKGPKDFSENLDEYLYHGKPIK